VKPLVPAAVLLLGLAYTTLGLITRSQEEDGTRRCTCLPDCWCQCHPLLGIYRWVFPFMHRDLADTVGDPM
jgi:hypothetical protein